MPPCAKEGEIMHLSGHVRVVTVVALLVTSLMGAGQVGGQSDPTATWEPATVAAIESLAERYNATLAAGATPRLSGERVTLRVRASGDDGGASPEVYQFTVGDDGRIRGVAPGSHPGETLVLSTSRGTIHYLATARDPVRAFESVFIEVGDVGGAGVTSEGGQHYVTVGEPALVVRLTINEEGVEEDIESKRSVRVLDLRGDRATLRSVPVGDFDGDGRPDVVVPGSDEGWLLQPVVRADGGSGANERASRELGERFAFKPERVEGIVEGGGDCDDDGGPIRPESPWGGLRCDGGVVVGAGTDAGFEPGDADLYIAVEEEGVKRTVREDAKRVSDDTALCPRETAKRTACEHVVVTVSGEVFKQEFGPMRGERTHFRVAGDAPVLAPGSVEVHPVAVDGGDDAVTVSLVTPRAERIDPVEVRGVGLVNGLKWRVVTLLRGLGLA